MRRRRLFGLALLPFLCLTLLSNDAVGCTTFVVNSADIDGDGAVNMTDLLELLGCWGSPTPAGCGESNLVDIGDCKSPQNNNFDRVDMHDLLFLLSSWTG